LFFPGPCAPQKLLAPNFLPARSLISQHLFDLKLGSNTSMIAAGNPEGGLATHSLVPDHQILEAGKERVAGVQCAGHIGRWNADDEGFSFRASDFWLEPAICFPPPVKLRFRFPKVKN